MGITDGVLSVVTCVDNKFEQFAVGLRRSAGSHSNLKVVVYDIDPGKGKMEAADYKIAAGNAFDKEDAHNNIIANHKPICLHHYIKENNRPCVALDADCFFTCPLDLSVFDGVDIAVTPRGAREDKPFLMRNGKINSGVVYLNNTPEVLDFIKRWEALCADGTISDQKALSDMLEEEIEFDLSKPVQKYKGMTVKLLDPDEFNDVTCKTGRIFHCKSVGRRKAKYIFYRAFIFMASTVPGFLDKLISLNRKHRFVVYKRKEKYKKD
ncbi:MAG: putative nucleotide-diphospho-sugar transferase [Desulfovibrio sp.]